MVENQSILLFKSAFTGDTDFRVYLDNTQIPWFVGTEICTFLGYKNARQTLHDHVDDEDKIRVSDINIQDCIAEIHLPNHPATTLINESGLYSLILRSKLPAAKAFKRWVTSEVLPSIRKNGEYTKLQLETKLKELECDLEFAEVEIGSLNASLRQTTAEKDKIEREFVKLQKNHNVILTKRSYHKFKKGPCFYIVKDDWRERNYYKIGETSDINSRLATYRTSMPRTKILYLLYLGENKFLENAVRFKFKKCLSDQNKEYIAGVPLSNIIKQIETIVRYFHFDATCESMLDLYNKDIDIDDHISDTELPFSEEEEVDDRDDSDDTEESDI